MKNRNKLWSVPRHMLLTLTGILIMFIALTISSKPQTGLAAPGDLSSAAIKYPNISGTVLQNCTLCHTSSIPNLNPYGAAYKANGRNSAAFGAIENLDSDGDGFTNIQEFNSLTFPGDPSSFPAVPIATKTSLPPTATKTLVPPTPTKTTLPPTATKTLVPPTATKTTLPPTATKTTLPPTPTKITLPPGTPGNPAPAGLDLDIRKFKVAPKRELETTEKTEPIEIKLDVKNTSLINGQGIATIVGVQNGVEIYRVSMPVSDPIGGGSTRVKFPDYIPTAIGKIEWTVTLDDGVLDPDVTKRSTDVIPHQEDSDGD